VAVSHGRQEPEPEPEPELEPEPEDAAPQHPRWSRRRKIVTWIVGVLALVLIAAGITVGVVWYHLDHNIRTVDAVVTPSVLQGTQDILLVGSDDRSGSDAKYGTSQGARSDTTILFHTPADRRDATAVSIPRDSMVQIPACTRSDGTVAAANYGMFNSAYDTGGIACTVKTVQALTGITLTHFVVLDFTGFVKLVNALGGVKVCVTTALTDADSGLKISAGTSTLDGDQALAFVRVRHIGDGSDLSRIKRQQYFLDRMATQVRASGLTTKPIQLYQVLDAATQAIITDTGLGSLTSLKSLANSLNQIPNGKTAYATVPTGPYPADPNRVIWTQPTAANLWSSLKNEAPSASASSSGTATSAASAGTSTSAAAPSSATSPTTASATTSPTAFDTCPVT
jgi:LCP family protein required for cell wall assembly